ncbi:unnamed protein product [Oncorhynchus mykiss]|uniref:Clathrin adaptor alpha/beta/gamma-adaptin appendage Ig-like subdomain domain-containing protein n=1 Tax=Oncorhynchus mykiss TaxID=8022 RepID=A0A060YP13_ONCMY|nr:unnamed protein product [Oncorhynchus mykiss]
MMINPNTFILPPARTHSLSPSLSPVRFVCKNNGVLFENQLLQIGIKSEYRQNLGRMYLFYGNKTSVQFVSFSTIVSCPGELQSHILQCIHLLFSHTHWHTSQVQQVINIECLTDFIDAPLLNIKFRYGGALQNISLKLPVTINKFFQPTEMAAADFFQRWKQLSQPQQEAQKIFKASHGMDTEVLKAKLLGLGTALLENVDPNPENYVCAGVIQTKAQQVGCLLRLEPNAQAQVRTRAHTIHTHKCTCIHTHTHTQMYMHIHTQSPSVLLCAALIASLTAVCVFLCAAANQAWRAGNTQLSLFFFALFLSPLSPLLSFTPFTLSHSLFPPH